MFRSFFSSSYSFQKSVGSEYYIDMLQVMQVKKQQSIPFPEKTQNIIGSRKVTPNQNKIIQNIKHKHR